ncbi:MAG: hypothetical protein ACK5QX_05915, partial [bacterium]
DDRLEADGAVDGAEEVLERAVFFAVQPDHLIGRAQAASSASSLFLGKKFLKKPKLLGAR